MNMKKSKVTLNHGAGGRQMGLLIRELIVEKLSNGILERLDDSAILKNNLSAGRIAMTTDSYVVSPLFFPGGDIGRLAVSGTVNDLTTSGARPYALSLAFILEEGVSFETISTVVDSIAKAAKEAKVLIVTGDTKVVEAGKGDQIYINTCGIGFIEDDALQISSHNLKKGDVIMVTGPIGNHEIAMLAARKGVDFDMSSVESDVAPLCLPMQKVLVKAKQLIHAVKDPTRGGIAGVLLEMSEHSQACIEIKESAIPIDKGVHAVCELLGFDPLYLANEGKFVIACEESAVAFVEEFFKDAKVIGKVSAQAQAQGEGVKKGVFLEVLSGGIRRIAPLETTQLPRIC
ncbi:MAG: hydrogenase expression/formation protein HypE [Oligoflexia bacterium]|nr:hydrogenase expression/formation protein HypE [Oligoflexia bacterium]